MLIEGNIARQEIIGPDDRRIATRIAAADPTFFDNGHIGDAEILRKVIGCREAVAAAADNDDVIALLWRRISPCRLPAAMPGQRLTRQVEQGVALPFHVALLTPCHKIGRASCRERVCQYV